MDTPAPPLRVFTGADRKFAPVLRVWLDQAEHLGLASTVYDLGGLEVGIPWPVHDASFHQRGYYTTSDRAWKARALHKPDIVLDHLERFGDGWYLDADAVPIAPLEFPSGDDWDLSVTVRRPGVAQELGHPSHRKYMGEINAGVMAFRTTARTLGFIPTWKTAAHDFGSDQYALNELLSGGLPRDGSVVERSGVRVKCLPTDTHNFYYLSEQPPDDARVLHFKNGSWATLLKTTTRRA